MKTKQLISHETDIKKIAEDLKMQLGDFKTKALLVFSSWFHDHQSLSKELHHEFPGMDVFGCSSYGEYINDKYHKNTTVAMALGDDLLEDIHIEVIEDVHNDLAQKTKNAFLNFEKHYGIPVNKMDHEKFVGMVLIDWCLIEEKVMEHIGDHTNVIFVGGTSADKDFVDYLEHAVFCNGKAYRDAAVLALMKPKVEFEVIKTESFRVLDKKLTATKVDVPNRQVIEFNNKPAIEAYAEALGVSIDKAEEFYWTNPLGVVVTDHPFVRSPIPGGKNGSIMFCCNILENMDANLLQETEIVDETKLLIDRIKVNHSHLSGLIQFNCSARTIELENRNIIDEYADVFKDIPHLGISCFGESYLAHINQSATLLLFK